MTLMLTDDCVFMAQAMLPWQNEEGALVCPCCYLTWTVPLDWWADNVGNHIRCPGCAQRGSIPRPLGYA